MFVDVTCMKFLQGPTATTTSSGLPRVSILFGGLKSIAVSGLTSHLTSRISVKTIPFEVCAAVGHGDLLFGGMTSDNKFLGMAFYVAFEVHFDEFHTFHILSLLSSKARDFAQGWAKR